MTVRLHFAGWFQCRLATDPDPCDEPRGVSGYAQALAGEPDLDRIIRLQPDGAVERSHCPRVGVTVRQVVLDGRNVPDHPLLGAAVELLDEAKFEGRNGIVAEDGFEPIVPVHLAIRKGPFRLQRTHLDEETFPYAELQASGVQPGVDDIAQATGIWDLQAAWEARRVALERDLQATDDPTTKVALTRRIQMLTAGRLSIFFFSRMLYAFNLQGTAHGSDTDGFLPAPPDSRAPWPVDFWLGGWDADAFCGFMKGAVSIETAERGRRRTTDARASSGVAALYERGAPLRA
jgi:hypothetical protein